MDCREEKEDDSRILYYNPKAKHLIHMSLYINIGLSLELILNNVGKSYVGAYR